MGPFLDLGLAGLAGPTMHWRVHFCEIGVGFRCRRLAREALAGEGELCDVTRYARGACMYLEASGGRHARVC